MYPSPNVNISSIVVENHYRKVLEGYTKGGQQRVMAWESHYFPVDASRNMGLQYLYALNNALHPNCIYEVYARIVWPQTPEAMEWSPPLLAFRNDGGLSLKWAKYHQPSLPSF